MKDKGHVNDIVGVNLIKGSGRQVEELKFKGETRLRVIRNGLVIVDESKPNSLNSSLLEYLQSRLDSTSQNKALDNLFTTAGEEKGGSQDGKDGIVVAEAGTAYLSTVTTTRSASQTFGNKWRGDITFSTAYDLDRAVLGWGFGSGSGVQFTDPFATQIINQSVQQSDRVLIDWEIYL